MGILRQLSFWKRGPSRKIAPFDEESIEVRTTEPAGPKAVGSDLRSSTPGSSSSESTSTSSETELTQAPEEDVTSTHTSETGSGEISQEPIDFRASTVEIAFPIAAEFGDEVAEGLRSSKWDRRQRALQSISSALNGGHLWSCGPFRERRGAWRVSCQVLNHVLKDKVIPVKLAALQLFRDTFENIDPAVTVEEVQHALDVLIGPVMSCLGDSNVRLHESAQSNLVFARYLLGDKLLHRLRAFLEQSSERSKAHFGVLDTVNALLRTSPTSPWPLEDLVQFIPLGLEDSLGPRCRHSAVALAVTLYRLHGPPCGERILQRCERAAKQQLLRQRFREVDEEHGQELHPDLADDADEGEARPDLDDLLLCHGTLPGQVAGDEESFMDGILEETGHVFQGSDLATAREKRRSTRKSVSFSNTDDIVEVERDEELILEHEALALGVDIEDDHEALLREILMDSDEESATSPCYSGSGV